jgi:hypothetical protein
LEHAVNTRLLLEWLAEYAARMAAEKRPRAEISGVEHGLNIIQRIEKGRGT